MPWSNFHDWKWSLDIPGWVSKMGRENPDSLRKVLVTFDSGLDTEKVACIYMDPEKYSSCYEKLEEWETQRRMGTARIPKDVIIKSAEKVTVTCQMDARATELPSTPAQSVTPQAREIRVDEAPGASIQFIAHRTEEETGIDQSAGAVNPLPSPESLHGSDEAAPGREDESMGSDERSEGIVDGDSSQVARGDDAGDSLVNAEKFGPGEMILEDIRGPASDRVLETEVGCPKRKRRLQPQGEGMPPRRKRAPNRVIDLEPNYPTLEQQKSINEGADLWDILESLGPLGKNQVFEKEEEAMFRMWAHCIIVCRAYPYSYYNRKERKGFACVPNCKFKITANETERDGKITWKIKTIMPHSCSVEQRRPYPITPEKVKVLKTWMTQLFVYANDNGRSRKSSMRLGVGFIRACLSAKGKYVIPAIYDKNLDMKVRPLYNWQYKAGRDDVAIEAADCQR